MSKKFHSSESVSRALKVLFLEDNPGDARLIQEMLSELKGHDIRLEWVDRLSKGIDRLGQGDIQAVLSDLSLPDSAGLETFLKLQESAPSLPIVILSGSYQEESLALEAVRKGAQDYLVKGKVDGDSLIRILHYAVERKNSEAMLKKYAKELEEANQLKQLFMDILSHDLLNPIAAVKEASDLILEMEKDKEVLEIAQTIKQISKKILEMIESAKIYAKLESSEKWEWRKIDLHQLLSPLPNHFKSQLDEKKLTLEYRGSPGFCCNGHSTLENVFTNLLSNAIKYSPEGQKIEISLTQDSGFCEVRVKDCGYGIKDEDKLKLFTRFQRVDKQGVKGTGLGLAIVKRVVELHGGKVWIEDNPGGGSIFIVRLPKIL